MAFAAAEIFLANEAKVNTNANTNANAQNHTHRAIILETAHPVKFPEVVEEAIGEKIEVPASVQFLLDKAKVSIPLAANYPAFKQWMMR